MCFDRQTRKPVAAKFVPGLRIVSQAGNARRNRVCILMCMFSGFRRRRNPETRFADEQYRPMVMAIVTTAVRRLRHRKKARIARVCEHGEHHRAGPIRDTAGGPPNARSAIVSNETVSDASDSHAIESNAIDRTSASRMQSVEMQLSRTQFNHA